MEKNTNYYYISPSSSFLPLLLITALETCNHNKVILCYLIQLII